MNVLFLDDCPNRQRTFRAGCPWATIVATAEEAIAALKAGTFHIILLDHDLGGQVYVESVGKDTGAEVARWLAANKHSTAELVIVHSLNDGGSKEMLLTLKDAGYNTQKIMFTQFDDMRVCEALSQMRKEWNNEVV